MPSDNFFDRIENAVKSERVWLPGSVDTEGRVHRIQQVSVENKGAPKGKAIFLSRRKPFEREEQDIGTFKHNEVRKTVDLREREIVANSELGSVNKQGIVYMKRIGANVPRYLLEKKTTGKFLHSLELARMINEKKKMQARSEPQKGGALVKDGLAISVNSDLNLVVGGSMSD